MTNKYAVGQVVTVTTTIAIDPESPIEIRGVVVREPSPGFPHYGVRRADAVHGTVAVFIQYEEDLAAVSR